MSSSKAIRHIGYLSFICAILFLFSAVGFAQNDSLEEYIHDLDVLEVSDIKNEIDNIWIHGLNPRDYWRSDLDWWSSRSNQEDPKFRRQALAAFLDLLIDLNIGSVDPEKMGSDVKLKRKVFITLPEFKKIIQQSGGKANYLIQRLAPNNPVYQRLSKVAQILFPYCVAQKKEPLFEIKKSFSVNQLGDDNSDIENKDVILKLKIYLRVLGYQIENLDPLFDEQVRQAVGDIQSILNWKPDGILTPQGRTWRYLQTSCKSRLHQVQVDMEKLRWFSGPPAEAFAFINLASSTFELFDSAVQKDDLNFRVINGRPKRKSPTMQDLIVAVILNPDWVVPKTIFFEDKIPEIAQFSEDQIDNYFKINNFEVWDKHFSKKIDPRTIHWQKYLQANHDADIYIRQRPNPKNVLGLIKFELANPYSIYLHDTDQPEKFSKLNRHLSSGCIRLENPLSLAEYLLKSSNWDQQKIIGTVLESHEENKEPIVIPLEKPFEIYVASITTEMSEEGLIRFYPDYYKQNQIIEKKMRGIFE